MSTVWLWCGVALDTFAEHDIDVSGEMAAGVAAPAAAIGASPRAMVEQRTAALIRTAGRGTAEGYAALRIVVSGTSEVSVMSMTSSPAATARGRCGALRARTATRGPRTDTTEVRAGKGLATRRGDDMERASDKVSPR